MARTARARQPADGQATAPPSFAGADPDERIAVVFVHGQGEQTPMTDVIDLADTVWRSDPRAWGNKTPPQVDGRPALAPVYSVPVYDEAESDQRRITTRIVKMADGKWRQADFYQFYWADLMRGNRFVHLWIWFTGLMTRAPNEVPGAVWMVRMIAMLAALAVGAWGALFAAATAMRLAELKTPPAAALWVLGLVVFLSLLFIALGWRPDRHRPDKKISTLKANAVQLVVLAGAAVPLWYGIGAANHRAFLWGAAGIVVIALALLVSPRLPRPPPGDAARLGSLVFWLFPLAGLMVLYGAGLAIAASVGAGWSWRNGLALTLAGGAAWTVPLLFFPYRRAAAMGSGMILIVLSLAVSLFILFNPAAFAQGWVGWSLDRPHIILLHQAAAVGLLALVLVGGYLAYQLNESFLTPVMADSARMFSNSPPAIPNQDAIRKRGMELLKFLHNPRAERRYDRVVVLAHSLGTAVAYRLLAHYWGKVYGKLPARAAATEAAAVEQAATALNGTPNDANRRAWREAVRAYGAALRAAAPADRRPWLITDFVTIGSPLTYARLLLEDSDRDFLRQIRIYKRHPTSPPQPADVLDDRVAPTGPIFGHKTWPHHAALFAATTWTNLFFPPQGLSRGDLIGGPIAKAPPEGLGPGVLDVNLIADNEVEGFTHGNYWLWPVNMRLEVSPPGAPPAAPLHVAALRDALGLFETGDIVDQRLQNPAGYPRMPLVLQDRA